MGRQGQLVACFELTYQKEDMMTFVNKLKGKTSINWILWNWYN